jgi:anaerobic selenocysteine-containing dehydrogenase
MRDSRRGKETVFIMQVTRRQFLKISSGAIGTVAAAEAMSLGADTSATKEQAQKVPIKTGKQVPKVCTTLPSVLNMEV